MKDIAAFDVMEVPPRSAQGFASAVLTPGVNLGTVRFSVTPGGFTDAATLYLSPAGVPLDKVNHLKTTVALQPGANAIAWGDPAVVNQMAAASAMDRQWAATAGGYAHGNTNLDNRCIISPDGINWRSWSVPNDAVTQQWASLVYAPELGRLCAIAATGGTNTQHRAMTSDDGGETWTLRAIGTTSWRNVAWGGPAGDRRFIAVSSAAAANNITTSSNGINWAYGTKPNTNQLRGICWSPALNLWVAVGDTGTGNRAFTSADGGTTWIARTTPADIGWNFVCWSPERNLFVAVAASGTGPRVMTSPNGVTWTLGTAQPAGFDLGVWQAVMWVPELGKFVANCSSGLSPRIWLSSDGFVWTPSGTTPNQSFFGLAWSPTLALLSAACSSGTTKGQTSPDGVTWTARANGPWVNLWNGICWVPAPFNRFVAVGTLNNINPELIYWPLSIALTSRIRYTLNLLSGTVTFGYVNPSRNLSGTPHTVPGPVLSRVAPVAAAQQWVFASNTDMASEFSNLAGFLETPACLPQGAWDVHMFPLDYGGREGPETVFPGVTIV